jgi:hypothetical protein
MASDYILPASVICLKFVFKLVIGHEVKKVDIAKALIVFPIDIVFLSFSFGAAVLYSIHAKSPAMPTVKEAVLFTICCCLAAAFVALLCKISGKAFESDNNLVAIAFGVISYSVSVPAALFSLKAGVLLNV